MRLHNAFGFALVAGLLCVALSVSGCGGSDDCPPPFCPECPECPDCPDCPEPPIPEAHDAIVLLDRLGNQLTLESTEPYSSRKTCGRCHDIDAITNAYHFQQGRTSEEFPSAGLGESPTALRDDYFDDGRFWLKSAGMYGKW